MAWVVDPDTIVAGADTGGVGYFEPGSVCPTGWTEDFDRAQMSTQVMIGHGTPSDIPIFRYNFPGSIDSSPDAGAITLNGTQTAATKMYVSKIGVGGLDHVYDVWLRYVRKDDSVSLTSVARTDPDDNNKTRGYRITADPVEHPGWFEWTVFWTDGTEAFDPGAVDLRLSLRGEVPRIFQDAFGVEHYGRMTYQRTDLIRVDPLSNPIYTKLADRILEVRGSNSVPRLESVTIDARTGPDFYPIHHANLMSSVDPGKPSRYMCCLKVDGRTIFHQLCFASGVRHFISRDEWTTTITLDLAAWAGTL